MRMRAGGNACTCACCRPAANSPNYLSVSRTCGISSSNAATCCCRSCLELAKTTAATVRKLEDRGLIDISPEISERDPYAREHILPSQPLTLNAEQVTALEQITRDDGLQRAERMPFTSASTSTFLLHGVTGSGKTEIYLQAIAHALEQGKGAIVLVPEISLTPQTVERFKARFSSGKLQTLVAVLHQPLDSVNGTMNGTRSGRAGAHRHRRAFGHFRAG